MSDKPLPAFNFGAPASSGSSTPSLFGTATNTGQGLFGSNSGNTGSKLLGNTASTGGNTGLSLGNLGKTPATSRGEEKKTLFPAATDTSKPSGLFSPSHNGGGATSPFSMGAGTGTSGGFGGFSFDKGAQTPAKSASSAENASTTPAPNVFQ